jgi:hypothetical protein
MKYDSVDSAVRRFTILIQDKGLNPQKCAVLVRKSDSVDEVRSAVKPSKLKGAGAMARQLIESYALLARGDRNAAHQLLANAVVDCGLAQSPASRDVTTRREAKRDLDGRCGDLLDRLPGTDRPLGKWALEVRTLLTAAFPGATAGPQKLSGLLKRPSSVNPETPICDLIPQSQSAGDHVDVPVSTVHGVKGKNLQGVMLLTLVKKKYDSGWLDETLGPDGFWPEETRIAYVAMTRAERLLVLAIPATAPASVLEHPKLAGFVPLE